MADSIAPRIAFVSEKASTSAAQRGHDAGGQTVYVDQLTRHLGRLGYEVDVLTRRDALGQPEIVPWTPNVRLVNLPVGPPRFLPKVELWPLMPAFRDELLRFRRRDGARYD